MDCAVQSNSSSEEPSAWIIKLFKPTKDDFEEKYIIWNVLKSKKQFCGINDQQCPGSASAWDVSSISTAMLFQDQEKMGSIMDAELCLDRDFELPRLQKCKFVAGLACYHSAHIMHIMQVQFFAI